MPRPQPPATRTCWAGSSSFGTVELVGVEGTGSYGAGLTRHLHGRRVRVVEVDRPNRQRRRRKGKSDPQDAVAAARAAQGGRRQRMAKTRDGNVEAMRVLRVARSSARRSSDPGAQPDAQPRLDRPRRLRAELRDLSIYKVLPSARRLSPHRTRPMSSGHQAHAADAGPTGPLPRRRDQRDRPDAEAPRRETAPELIAIDGVGTDVASALLVAAGDNPERLKNEATFAHLCGVSPLDASSGKHERHRLNRSGDRQANSALWHIVFTRMVNDPRTKHYIERRMKEGRTKKEAIRCLKRYVAREVFAALPRSAFRS